MPLVCSVVLMLLSLSALAQASLQDRQTDCGLRVFSHLARSSAQSNVVVSPYGVASVLAMAQLGAAGKTRRALTSAVGFSLQGESSSVSQGVRPWSADHIWSCSVLLILQSPGCSKDSFYWFIVALLFFFKVNKLKV